MTTAADRERLILDHVQYARRIASKMARRVPASLHEDVLAAGMLGLVDAATRYDPDRSGSFVTFADRRIRGSVIDELRSGDVASRRLRQLTKRIARFVQVNGGCVDEEAIAKELCVPIAVARAGVIALTMERVDLDYVTSAEMATYAATDALATADRVHRLARVARAAETLDARTLAMLRMQLDGVSLDAIGEAFEVSTSRACQLLKRAAERLRVLCA